MNLAQTLVAMLALLEDPESRTVFRLRTSMSSADLAQMEALVRNAIQMTDSISELTTHPDSLGS